MQISHEVPITILEESRTFNDYEYALVHLYDISQEYRDFYIESSQMGRRVILDNSIFELGEAYDSDKFLYHIEDTKPSDYIIPDSLENAEQTILNAQNWMKNILPKLNIAGYNPYSIGVVQGKTYEEICKCYKALISLGVDKIAISFDYSYYETLFPHPNKLMSWAMGRSLLLHKMLHEGIIDRSKDHHLLGCSLPIEFRSYKNMPWIESMDTSNPVVHGMLGIDYIYGFLQTKASVKLNEMIFRPVPDAMFKRIVHNVMSFREHVNG